jgi:hypothetical protein
MCLNIVGTGIKADQPSPYTSYADERPAVLTWASLAFSVHALFTISFQSLRAVTGMAKHGAYIKPQHLWQRSLRSYLPTTRRTNPKH